MDGTVPACSALFDGGFGRLHPLVDMVETELAALDHA